ncbi:MAG: THxN family PEP-CTERM protein [Cyanobacteria bacterium J06581_3]
MKPNIFSSALVGTTVIAAALGAANPAEAFVLANTKGSWDNAKISAGYTIGSDGYAARPWNDVIFQENGNDSQVRWGDSVYGSNETWAYNYADRMAGHNYDYGWYTNPNGYWVEGWHHYDYVSEYEKKSGLGFEGVSGLSIDTGDIFNVGSLTHFNQTIWTNGKIATSAELSLELDFGANSIGTQVFDFTLNIDETDNDQAVCPYQTSGYGCSDKITWDFAIDQESSFMYENEEYTLELIGFSEQVAASSIVNEFISNEKADNSANLFARLIKVDTTQDIPEPASILGLAGLGLFAVTSRKKRVSQLLEK